MRSPAFLVLLLVFVSISVPAFVQPHPTTSDWARNNPGIVGDTVYNSPAYLPRTSRTHRPIIRADSFTPNNTQTDEDFKKPRKVNLGLVLGLSILAGILISVFLCVGIVRCVQKSKQRARVKAKSSV